MSDELRKKKVIADMLIGMLAKDDDPRVPEAIANLERQKQVIDDMLAEPAHVIVGLKPAVLSAQAES